MGLALVCVFSTSGGAAAVGSRAGPEGVPRRDAGKAGAGTLCARCLALFPKKREKKRPGASCAHQMPHEEAVQERQPKDLIGKKKQKRKRKKIGPSLCCAEAVVLGLLNAETDKVSTDRGGGSPKTAWSGNRPMCCSCVKYVHLGGSIPPNQKSVCGA
mgnify:CR=1 FL=1